MSKLGANVYIVRRAQLRIDQAALEKKMRKIGGPNARSEGPSGRSLWEKWGKVNEDYAACSEG